MKEKIYRMMQGRNGIDSLSRFLSYFSFILLVIAIVIPETFRLAVWLVAVCILVVAYVRIFSRDIYKRQAENTKYLQIKGNITRCFRREINRLKLRNEYRFFKCPGCKVTIRIPRGKGNIMITCPKCRTSFKGKS